MMSKHSRDRSLRDTKLLPRIRTSIANLVDSLFRFHRPDWANSIGVEPATLPKPASFLNPFRWGLWGLKFLWEWITCRPYTSLLPALPSIVLGLIVAALTLQHRYQLSTSRPSMYRKMLAQAIENKSWDRATVILGSLIDMNPSSESLRIESALLEEKRGNQPRAVEMMSRLVLSTKSSKAALWLIVNEIDLKNVGGWTIDTHKRFRVLVEIAMSSTDSETRTSAEQLMATYLLAINAKKEAAKYLASVANRNPSFALTTATVFNELGDRTQSQIFAQLAQKFYEPLVISDQKDVSTRMLLAKSLAAQYEEELASKILLEGFKLTQNESLKTNAGEVLLYRIYRMKREAPSDLLARMAITTRAFELAPDSDAVVDEVIDLLFDCRESRSEAIVDLRSNLVKKLDSRAVHFVKGTLALFDNRFDDARKELEVINDDSQMPGVMNNLAMAIMKSKDGELETALKFAEMANQLLPNHPYFRDTRGQVLVKLGRYNEAVPDLEFALKAPELAKEVHVALAIAYKELGNNELSELHKSLSK